MGAKAKGKEIVNIKYFYQQTASEANLTSIIESSFRHFIKEELAKKSG